MKQGKIQPPSDLPGVLHSEEDEDPISAQHCFSGLRFPLKWGAEAKSGSCHLPVLKPVAIALDWCGTPC